MSLYDACPGSRRIKTPYPEEIKCSCGHLLEIWSDEVSIVCKNCQKKLTRTMAHSCLDWCAMARECIGEKKYQQYLHSRKQKKKS
ncbi:MAG: hypothetical protein JW714_03530 [Candidatus Omnitrophica bacterium]|nr:hypothetical protein [Candidatus Omnitrophota bacterium]